MVFENIVISDASIREIVTFSLTLLVGIFISIIARFLIKKFADILVYPSVRKSSPKNYKKATSMVNITALIVQWIIIFIFIFQALSVFDIFIFEEIVRISISILPKFVVALFIIVIGLILNAIFSRKILAANFENRALVSKVFGFVFMFAVVLSALEVVNINLTPFMELFKVFLYTIGLTIAIGVGLALGHALKPELEAMINDIKNKKVEK